MLLTKFDALKDPTIQNPKQYDLKKLARLICPISQIASENQCQNKTRFEIFFSSLPSQPQIERAGMPQFELQQNSSRLTRAKYDVKEYLRLIGWVGAPD